MRFWGIFKPMGGFGAWLPPWDAACRDLGVENQQLGGGPDLVGLVLVVIASLCFMVRGFGGAGATRGTGAVVWDWLSRPGSGLAFGSVLLADRSALISHYRVRAVFRP